MKFRKPALSISDQVALLKRRGMVIRDDSVARHSLGFLSYYRLRAYWLPFEVPADARGDHAFRANTTLEDVLSIYRFDRRLRLLVLDAIGQVEVAFRGLWAHHMAMRHGPHGYLNPHLYARRDRHNEAVAKLTVEFNRSRATFAEHYRGKYASPKLPPIWMAAETISLGQLSKWIRNLKFRADRKAIAQPLGLSEVTFTSFCHHISYVRNICAHHGRLWNKRFTVTMSMPNRPAELADSLAGTDPKRIYCTLAALEFLLTIVSPGNDWRERLESLVEDNPLADPESMGFPRNWRQRPIWNKPRCKHGSLRPHMR